MNHWKKDSKNWTAFQYDIEPFVAYDSKELNPFFCIRLKELNFAFFLIWLKELNLSFFEYDSKFWTLIFNEYDSKNLFFKYFSKNCFVFWIWLQELNFFLSTTQRIEPLKSITPQTEPFCWMWPQKIEPFYDSKTWAFFFQM